MYWRAFATCCTDSSVLASFRSDWAWSASCLAATNGRDSTARATPTTTRKQEDEGQDATATKPATGRAGVVPCGIDRRLLSIPSQVHGTSKQGET